MDDRFGVMQGRSAVIKAVFVVMLTLAMSACAFTAADSPTPQVINTATPQSVATETSAATATPTAEIPPTIPSTPITPLDPDTITFPPPQEPYPLFAQAPVTQAEQQTAAALIQAQPLERDNIALALAYGHITAVPDLAPEPTDEPLALGTRHTFNILNTTTNTRSVVEAELQAISDHGYFWFDVTAGNAIPTAAQLDAAAAEFDEIYEQVIFYFGPENNPGIDGDPRVHIFNASPLTICPVTVETAVQCGLLGYFSSFDTLPKEVTPLSNQREMFVMNGSRFGSAGYLEVLAHEFRHMIEYNHDRNDLDWEVEGSAMLAEDLLGYANDAHNRANLFIANPDQQLNRWSESNTAPRYGQGYALNRYIYDRLGTDLHREFATSDETGLNAVTEVAAAHNLGFTGLELWLDWLVALAIHDRPQTAALYKLPSSLITVRPERLFSYPYETETVVNQYAADYYTFLGEGEATVTFTGSTHVPLLEIQPASGAQMWLAQRANYSQMQLTREFDLTAVSSATLFYDVYYDIEAGYDFAYVALSTNGGQTWTSLETPHMQSKAAGDDPSDSALADTFYTDLSGQWLTETVDLSAYAGQRIHLRFEYVTDPILNFGGLAIDNILIPEIGFVDDVETNQGWATAGFVRATAAIPQQWHLQLITFEDGVPVIREIAMNETNSIAFLLSLDNNVDEYPILVVAATAPMTLQPAHYQLNVTP